MQCNNAIKAQTTTDIPAAWHSISNNPALFGDNPALSHDKGALLKFARTQQINQKFLRKFGGFKKLSYLCTQLLEIRLSGGAGTILLEN